MTITASLSIEVNQASISLVVLIYEKLHVENLVSQDIPAPCPVSIFILQIALIERQTGAKLG